MFPTPKQRYERYVAWCHLIGAPSLDFNGWLRLGRGLGSLSVR